MITEQFNRDFARIFGGKCGQDCALYDGDTCRCGFSHPHDEGVIMDMKDVNSSQIHSVGYDPATKVLAVRFKRGGEPADTYHYADITPEQHTAFIGAESVGKHFHANLRSIPGVKQS